MEQAQYEELMNEEIGKWNELGVMPGEYRPQEGLLGIIFRFETLNQLLVQKGIITEEEADEMYRDVALSGLKEVREKVVGPAVEEAKQAALRAKIIPANGAMHIPRKPKKH